MSSNRRDFIRKSALGAGVLGVSSLAACASESEQKQATGPDPSTTGTKPIVIATWAHGMPANEKAWELLSQGKSSLDAVEAGVRVVESDPEVQTVGLGGFPDRDGVVSLDACIMDYDSRCGSVAFLEEIENPISVARKVMEETPHIMLVGEGAQRFAVEQGFEKKNLLTEKSKEAYEKWLETAEYKPVINIENHDTISMLALDSQGRLAGACTTSGAAWKMHGRIGDSPIIGAGLFLDGEVGGACATGLGEAVIRVAGSAMVVELMRNGMSPGEACKAIVERIAAKHPSVADLQVGFLALDKFGNYGSYAIHKGFNFAVYNNNGNTLIDAVSKY
ncbi:MAG: N(4)-(beta-N-acetylglucosaminyl)-L-asparaginase [Imperialibacter sp.]|uniref:isoaspartyl peptidase/L-asparaginase family protein n=1 Tax=Imperialibacter sp. TaxID=2038411 RepID=UPI0032EBFA58